MVEAAPQPDIRGFWTWFAAHEAELLQIIKGERSGRITQLLDDALTANGLQLSYEVTEGSLGGELTFTPQGDATIAAFLDRFVMAAPTFDRWLIHSRVQRKPLHAAIGFVKALHGVDLTGLHFQVRSEGDVSHLQFIHEGLAALPEEQQFEVAATFLDHAVGEAIAMGFVGSVGFKPKGEGIEAALIINELIREAQTLAAAG